MSASKSPFAGLQLSDAGALDQHLFQSPASTQSTPSPLVLAPSPLIDTVTEQPAGQSIDRSTARSTSQEVVTSGSTLVARPKAFYITRRLDARLDEAVRYFQQQHGLPRVDRSTVVNALLDRDELWTGAALDHALDRVIGQLTSRLVGRSSDPATSGEGYEPDATHPT